MASIQKLLKNPAKIIYVLNKVGISKLIPDRAYLKLRYRANFDKKLNLKDPKTYNEKLQWLKLYDRNPSYIKMVDKDAVKRFVAEKIGDQYVIPTLGVWDCVEDIDFDSLPNQFVLKCTHDSGGLVICRDKSQLNISEAKKKLSRALRRNYYYVGREWPYKNVPKKIIAEKYMEDTVTAELRDYKFFCFNGRVKYFNIDFDRFIGHRANYYSPDGKLLEFGKAACPPDFEKQLSMPRALKKMIELAEILSADCPFMRVDFYEVNGDVYFGEMTFYPASGFGKFQPEEWDATLGSWLVLPQK